MNGQPGQRSAPYSCNYIDQETCRDSQFYFERLATPRLLWNVTGWLLSVFWQHALLWFYLCMLRTGSIEYSGVHNGVHNAKAEECTTLCIGSTKL